MIYDETELRAAVEAARQKIKMDPKRLNLLTMPKEEFYEAVLTFARKNRCALCGNLAEGYGYADGKMLCHHDSPFKQDCYHRWTVYGERPAK